MQHSAKQAYVLYMLLEPAILSQEDGPEQAGKAEAQQKGVKDARSYVNGTRTPFSHTFYNLSFPLDLSDCGGLEKRPPLTERPWKLKEGPFCLCTSRPRSRQTSLVPGPKFILYPAFWSSHRARTLWLRSPSLLA